MVQAKTTIWLTPDDNPVITVNEDGELEIAVPGAEHAWDIIIDPALFSSLREAIGQEPADEGYRSFSDPGQRGD